MSLGQEAIKTNKCNFVLHIVCCLLVEKWLKCMVETTSNFNVDSINKSNVKSMLIQRLKSNVETTSDFNVDSINISNVKSMLIQR